MNPALQTYAHQFTHLRSDRTGGWTGITNFQAPHKPFLLLSILDLFTQGRITNNLIEITPELGELFAAYWDKIMSPDRRGNLALPFFHLRSSQFWHLLPQPGQETALDHVQSVNSLSQLQKLVLGASLDDELYLLLQDRQACDVLRTMLIETCFAAEIHPVLRAQGDMNLQSFLYSQQLLERAQEQVKEAPEQGYQAAVRDQGFRRAVVRVYDHRCAFCGLRLMTSDGRTVVDAAHIVPWSISHDDDLHNGMALCRLCHWTFDQGLVGVTYKYLMLLSEELRIAQNMAGYLLTLENRSIIGPRESELWPRQESLEWHRQNVFREG